MNYTSLKELIEIDSPTGFTHIAAEYCFNYLKNLGFNPTYTIKGAVKCSLGENPTLCIAGHLDTLGAIISSINGDGTLSISLLGGLWPKVNIVEFTHMKVEFILARSCSTILLHMPIKIWIRRKGILNPCISG